MMRARVLVPLLAVIVATVCVRLGIWQLARLHQRRAHNAAVTAVATLPRLLLTDSSPRPEDYRRVEARGRWDYQHQIVLRQKTFEGVPGVELVTPLVLGDHGPAVMVLRGFVPSPDAMTVPLDSADEGDTGRVVGTALPIPVTGDGGKPLARKGALTWAQLDSSAIAARVPMPVLNVYVVEDETAPRDAFPRRIRMPALDDGPHLSYAIQWFGFAAIALAGAWFWLQIHPRTGRTPT